MSNQYKYLDVIVYLPLIDEYQYARFSMYLSLQKNIELWNEISNIFDKRIIKKDYSVYLLDGQSCDLHVPLYQLHLYEWIVLVFI